MAEFDPKAFLAKRRKEQPSIPADPPQASPFDPEAFLAAQAPQPRGPSQMRALGLAARSGPTLGADDELGGFLQGHAQFGATVSDAIYPDALLKWFRDRGLGFDPVRDADGQPVSPIDVFRGAQDSNEREKEEARAAHPGTFFLTELLSGAAIPLGTARTLGGALKTGAVVGGAAGLANSDADLTRGEFGEALTDIGTGAAFGAVLGAGGHAAGRFAPALLRRASQALRNLGVAQGRRVLLNGADSLSSKLKLSDEAVQEALDSGAIRPLGTTEGASKRLAALREQYGDFYGALVRDLEARGVPGARVQDVADRLLLRAAEEELATGASKAVPRAFMREAQNVENVSLGQPNLPLTRAEAIKRDLQAAASSEYGKMGGSKPLGEAKKEIASIFREANEAAIEEAGRAAPYGSELQTLADAFVPVKQRMGRLIEASDAAERGATRGANRSSGGLAGQVGAGTALATGNLPAAVGSATLASILRSAMNRGASTVASGANAAGRLTRAAANAASRHPSALPSAGLRLFSGYERALDAASQADGLSPRDRQTLAGLLRALRGELVFSDDEGEVFTSNGR